MGFLKDLDAGTKGEEFVKSIFGKHGFTAKIGGRLVEYDIEVDLPGGPATIESKFDLFCARSGNIAIEFFNPKQGKHSGIGATKADLWIHTITSPLSAWMTSVVDLKNFIATVKPHRVVTCGGDDNSSMYLYKKDLIFSEVFERIDECDTPSFLGVLNKFLRR